MALTIPTTEPTTLTAGDTVRWTKVVDADYGPASAYVAKWYLRGPSVRDLTGTDNGDGAWAVTIPASGAQGTASMGAGRYEWALVAETGSGDSIERIPLDRGTLVVTANLVSANAGERQSAAETNLTLAQARYAELLADNVSSYSVGQREAQRRSLAELRAEIAALKRQVAAERNGGAPPAVTFRFSRAV